jgi:beta-aspartyl-dipeptidase (metallo-type)
VLVRLDIGRVTSLLDAVRDCVRREQIPLATALQPVTSSPARILKLRGKGRIVAGADADITLLDPASLEVRGVVARGRWLMRDGEALVKGTFE